MEYQEAGEMVHPSRFYEFIKDRRGFVLRLWNDDRIEYQMPIKARDVDVAQRAAEFWLHHDGAVTVEHSKQRGI